MKPVYWVIAGIVLAILLSVGGAYSGYKYGVNKTRNEQLEAVNAYVKALSDTQKMLDKERKKIKVEYRDKIRYIHSASDDSGCLDASIPDDIMQQLRND